jgi:phosphatidylinositol-3-phosphatase
MASLTIAGCSASAASPAPASSPTVTSVCTSPAATATAAHGTTTARGTTPHIMIIMMENQGYGQIIGNSSAPCANTVASMYLRATNSYARGHDSLPNYLEMISGQAYEGSGTSSDCTPSSCGSITGPDLATQLQGAGIRWKAFMGAMPADCDTSDAGGSGGYGVRHDPFVYFPAGRTSPGCGNIVPAAGLMAALGSPAMPDFVFYSPSICDDGGNDAPCSTIANGDRFLAQTIPAIMATPWYRDGGTIVLTWDEGPDGDTSGRNGDNGGHVLTVVISARTKGHAPYAGYVDSAGILRAVEHAYGLGYLGDAGRASSELPLSLNGG